MNKKTFILIILFAIKVNIVFAQCSVCTKTAEQLGEGPASALNNAIVYLMMTPLLIMGYVGFRWWKKEKEIIAEEKKSR